MQDLSYSVLFIKTYQNHVTSLSTSLQTPGIPKTIIFWTTTNQMLSYAFQIYMKLAGDAYPSGHAVQTVTKIIWAIVEGFLIGLEWAK